MQEHPTLILIENIIVVNFMGQTLIHDLGRKAHKLSLPTSPWLNGAQFEQGPKSLLVRHKLGQTCLSAHNYKDYNSLEPP